MSHSEYKNTGTPIDCLIEEMAELTQALIKIKRFGLHNNHPDRPNKTNMYEALVEMEDVIDAMARVQSVWAKEEESL